MYSIGNLQLEGFYIIMAILLLLLYHILISLIILQILLMTTHPHNNKYTGSGVSGGHVSRYDPRNMNRITVNLADLVNDGSDSDDDATNNNRNNSIIESLEKGQTSNTKCPQVIVIVSSVISWYYSRCGRGYWLCYYW